MRREIAEMNLDESADDPPQARRRFLDHRGPGHGAGGVSAELRAGVLVRLSMTTSHAEEGDALLAAFARDLIAGVSERAQQMLVGNRFA